MRWVGTPRRRGDLDEKACDRRQETEGRRQEQIGGLAGQPDERQGCQDGWQGLPPGKPRRRGALDGDTCDMRQQACGMRHDA
jgi:hypothetical protein